MDWILRTLGGIIVAALAYVGLTFIISFDIPEPIVIGVSVLTGILAALFGWKAVEEMFKAIKDL